MPTDLPKHRPAGQTGRLLGLVVLASGAWPLWLRVSGNLHTVVPGEVYRAAQPESVDLGRWTRQYGIRSI